MVVQTRHQRSLGENHATTTEEHRPSTGAVTLEEDLSKMKEYRDRYLNRDKGGQSVFGRLSSWIRKTVFRLEVHAGPYMFDVREHVGFYLIGAVLLYLLGSSLLHVSMALYGRMFSTLQYMS
ncbi:hypothetical protein M9434_003942 [Picochlorum sp. BPE23]|nr:hypothetical protein M9434_003942 [Picochlorum sp. BPE23]|mmetsp:Transcript_11054/g.22078  ORF Transcript_11054/g.22078 Transcript_11054/m.22078 type:complete len:122 (+) Transcript_11054:87-452(+)